MFILCPCFSTLCDVFLVAARLKAKILAEERHHVILEAIRHGAGVRAVIHLKAVRDSVFIENVVQLAGIDAQPSWSPTSMEMRVYWRRLPMY